MSEDAADYDPTDGKIPKNIRDAIAGIDARLSRLPDEADLGADLTLIWDEDPGEYEIKLRARPGEPNPDWGAELLRRAVEAADALDPPRYPVRCATGTFISGIDG